MVQLCTAQIRLECQNSARESRGFPPGVPKGTRRRYLTRYKLSEEEAAERYPECERIDVTEETRTIYEGDAPISSHQLVFSELKKS